MEHRVRKNIRLRNFDYTQNGAYFVTICTHDREMLFGTVENGRVVHNEYGRIALEEIFNTNEHRKDNDIYISNYVVMPNHVHFIVNIVGTRLAVSEELQFEAFSNPIRNSLSSVIRSYKSAVTKSIRELFNGHGKPCPYTIWQSRYYEHIIRNEEDHRKISEYIENNPLKWEQDHFNTKSISEVTQCPDGAE